MVSAHMRELLLSSCCPFPIAPPLILDHGRVCALLAPVEMARLTELSSAQVYIHYFLC